MGRLCHRDKWQSLFEAVCSNSSLDGSRANKTHHVKDARTGISTLVLCI